MARFTKRGKTWTYVVEGGKDKDGNRKRITKGGFRTKEDAKYAAADIENSLGTGTYLKESAVTFKDYSDQWEVRYSADAKTGSVRIRRHHINRLLKYFNQICMKDITSKQYRDALYDLKASGLSETTISGIHGTAKMIFKDAVEYKAIKDDPTKYVRPPRRQETLEDIEKEEELPKYLEKDQLKTFLLMAHDGGLDQDYAIFLTLAYTGMRAGELCALKWSDVDFDNHVISVTKTLYNPTNNVLKYSLGTPKTKASKRKILIDKIIADELKLHQARQKKENMKNRNTWLNQDFVFTVQKYPGYPLYVKAVEIRMARLIRISGLPEQITPHSLRHTHTSLLAEAGVGLEEIMERLGHVDDDTTRKVYLHVTKEMKKEAAHKFSQLMNNL